MPELFQKILAGLIVIIVIGLIFGGIVLALLTSGIVQVISTIVLILVVAYIIGNELT